MKKLASVLMTGLMAASLMGSVAMADDTLTSSTSGDSEGGSVEKGPFTTDHPVFSRVVTLPFRAVTGGVGASAGFVGGTFKGIGTGVQDAFKYADEMSPSSHEDGDGVETTTRGVLYFPTAGVASALFVPRNVVEGSLKGAWDFGARGCEWWDRF